MKRKIAVIMFSLIILSGCGDITNTYNSQGDISVDNSKDDHSKNTEGQVAVSSEVGVDIDADKSTNNSTDNMSEISVYESKEYIQLKDENDHLRKENSNLQNQIDDLNSKQNNIPSIEYKDLGLSINGEDIPVNRNSSMVVIDGREYISKEIMENLVSNDKTIAIKDETLFIGKIIKEKSFLTDEVIVDSENVLNTNSIKDSYGNLHTNALYPQNYHSCMIVNLNRQFAYLKFGLAVQENGNSDAIVTIKADDVVVYTSPSLTITTEPFEVIDIPINNCSLLTIKIDSGSSNGFGKGFDCIISDAIVYN